MNRDHQFTPGTESERAAYFCDRCGRSREAHGDSTPPATPVEPPTLECCACGHLNTPQQVARLDGEWRSSGDYVCLDSDACARRIAKCSEVDVVPLASHPPAVSGEGERLKKFREHLVNYQQGTKQRGTGAYSRGEIVGVQGTLAVLLGEFDQLFPEVRASTPTPGAPR